MPRKKDDFSKLPLHIINLVADNFDSYLVYSSDKDFIKVQAPTATLAIEQSGIASPYKVVHLEYGKSFVLQKDDIAGTVIETTSDTDNIK